ncbi:hypothetical protein CTI12_AA194880 [Artemisia annua]|uniref:Uncharacterized protein n=1 Tax=Artemisia annua TaxID=35608 RepID=A0A2U1MP80_ARTAN|nr:hypothetical protein CTI12_AA194880 [Artemisia annua]
MDYGGILGDLEAIQALNVLTTPFCKPSPEIAKTKGTDEISPVISQESTPERTTYKQNRKKTVAKKKPTGGNDANVNEEKDKEAAKKQKKATPSRKRKETESPSAKTRSVAKKKRLEEEEARENKKKKKQIIPIVEKEKKVVKRKRAENEKKEIEKDKKVVKRKVKNRLENDEDFVVKKQMDKKKGKGKMEEQEDEDESRGKFFKSLRTKTTVKPFYDAIHSLKPERKERVREMGFGTLLGFPYNKFPSKLPYFILKHLDVDKMELKLPNGRVIEITPSKIREVLGIPMGPMSFYAEKKVEK